MWMRHSHMNFSGFSVISPTGFISEASSVQWAFMIRNADCHCSDMGYFRRSCSPSCIVNDKSFVLLKLVLFAGDDRCRPNYVEQTGPRT